MSLELSESVEIQVRFSEVDSMRVVWHGHYFKYFEDAREAFGRKYQIGYNDIEAQNLLVPVVHSSIDYKRPLRYGDRIRVEVRYEPTSAAKIVLHYTIIKLPEQMVTTIGKTIQVFTSPAGELQLLPPDYYRQWKEKWLA